MKRLAAAWAVLMLLAAPVVAKVVIIEPRPAPLPGAERDLVVEYRNRIMRLIKNALETTGAREGSDFIFLRSDRARVEDCRTGLMVWNADKAGATGEQFDGVIYAGWPQKWAGEGRGNSTSNTFRADSLTLAARISQTGGLLVPQLAFITSAEMSEPGYIAIADTSFDSTGVDIPYGANYTGTILYRNGTTNPWRWSVYMSGGLANATPPAGGFRKHISIGTGQSWSGVPTNVWGYDSTSYTPSADTLAMWERLMSHVTGSSPFVFCNLSGGGVGQDSLSNFKVVETPIEVMLCGLARMDSLTGGGVFGPKPLQIAIVVDRCLSRGNRLGPHGPYVDDESVYYAVLDSIKNLGVPITYSIPMDPDTLAEYADELAILKENPWAKFTPQTWTGLDSSVAFTDEDGNATWSRPVDVFGRWRDRAIYYADSVHTGGGADTTLYALLYSSFWHADSIFGRGRVSRVACAPEDDWTPLGVTGRNRASVADSVAWVCQKLGLRGIRVNGQVPEANASVDYGPASTNPRGYYNWQRRWAGSLGSDTGGTVGKFSINLLAHNGYPIIGSVWQYLPVDADMVVDTLELAGCLDVCWPFEQTRTWVGITQDWDREQDTFPENSSAGFAVYNNVYRSYADFFWPPTRANIRLIHSGDLSGAADGTNGAPARNGWWLIKSLYNAARAINDLAGRTIVEFTYPENIEP